MKIIDLGNIQIWLVMQMEINIAAIEKQKIKCHFVTCLAGALS